MSLFSDPFFFSAETKLNLSSPELVEEVLSRREGILSDTGALVCDTGAFTGRSPGDRYIVKDAETAQDIAWGGINQPLSEGHYCKVRDALFRHLKNKPVYVRDAYVGADEESRICLRVLNTKAWHNLFCYNMFLRVPASEAATFKPSFVLLAAPEFVLEKPEAYGVRSPNFVILNVSARTVLIGGTSYAGEMKKSMFTMMNFLLPKRHNILPMHCSANVGKDGDTAIFFGLSGTGKTTLSADPSRKLIGDDEHGWSSSGIFNFEGGCYAKVIHLSRVQEPQIWDAIRFGAVVENTRFFSNTRTTDYANKERTENTRVSYPLEHIPQARMPAMGPAPKNIFFLTADAFGVLPPISKLNPSQAMYHFLSGYTAKVAGTEEGIKEPQTVFSACFGAPFLPLSPVRYANMLGQYMRKYKTQVWLVNTGWIGGKYGVGERMKLPHTRALMGAALSGTFDNIGFYQEGIFGLSLPENCPGVPEKLLNPKATWASESDYLKTAHELASAFHKNFEKFRETESSLFEGAPLSGATSGLG